MSAPLVSIGMPVYNGERHLREALDSLVGQDYGNLEILISDNASSDSTPAICREYAERDPRVRYHRNGTNLGAPGNFNRVFRMAAGEFFMWAACDNTVAPSFVRKCVDLLQRHPEASLCHAQCQFISDDGSPLGPPRANYDNVDPSPSRRWKRVLGDRGYPEWYTAVYGLARTSCMKRTGLMRSVWGADQIFVAEMSLYGTVVQVAEPLWRLRQHDEIAGPEAVYRAVMQKLRPGGSSAKRRWTQLGIHTECARVGLRAPGSPAARLRLGAQAVSSYFSTGGWLNDLGELAAGMAGPGRMRPAGTHR